MARTQAPVGAPKPDAATQDHRTRLVALRDRLEAAIADAGNRDLAPLAGRYQAVLDQLAALPAETKGSRVDDLTAARARRRADTAAS